MRTFLTTLSIAYETPKVLLGMKKRSFGAGKWNGFGGKVEIETIEDNIRRETKEECNIEIKRMTKVGILDFIFYGSEDIHQAHIFRIDDFAGVPEETDEMRPKWFNADEIPFEDMWPDDVYWMPLFLSGKSLEADSLLTRRTKFQKNT